MPDVRFEFRQDRPTVKVPIDGQVWSVPSVDTIDIREGGAEIAFLSGSPTLRLADGAIITVRPYYGWYGQKMSYDIKVRTGKESQHYVLS